MKEIAKNAIKKIAAIGIGTAMLGATVFSAVAYDLSSYPQPFVKNGQWAGEIVVGNDAKVADVVGAIDIAASLQYAMKSAGTSGAVSSEGGVITVETSDAEIDGGALIKNSGNDLNLKDQASTVLTSAKLTDKELPTLLADGIVIDEDDSSNELDYEQSIVFAAGQVNYARNSDIGNEEDPSIYVDLTGTSTYDVVINLKDNMNFSAMGDSEKITLLGQEYTVKPNLAKTANLILLGSDNTVILELGETKTIGGIEYTLLGANSDNDNCILKVGSTQKTVTDGNTYTIGGNEVYVKSLYISTIPTTTASVEIMVGSQEVEIKNGALSNLKINGETVKGVTANVSGTLHAASEIRFRVDADAISDANKYLEMGTEFVDPVFGFKLAFTSASEELDAASKSKVAVEKVGDVIALTFTNDDGDEYSLDVYQYNTSDTDFSYADDFVATGSSLTENKQFLVTDSTGKVTYAYEVLDFDDDNDVNTTVIKDLSTGKETTLEIGDAVGDSGLTAQNITVSNKWLNLSGPVNSTFKIANEGQIALGAPSGNTSSIVFTEGNKADESAVTDTATVTISLADPDGSGTEKIGVTNAVAAGANSVTGVTNKDSKVGYALTQFGTFVKFDKEDGTYLDMYYPADAEVKYFVSVSSGDSSTSGATKEYSEGDVLKGIGTIKAITAGSVTGGSFNVNPIGLPLAKLDVDTTLGSNNQIIVGGPAVNKLAAEAVGVTYPAYGLSSGLLDGAGEAVIKSVEKGTKVALVVAGWEAADTQRATTVLANYDKYASKLTGNSVKITGTISSPMISLVVAETEVAEADAEAPVTE